MTQIHFEINLLNLSTLKIVVFIAFLHHLSNVIKKKQTAILLSHHEKLEKFRIRQKKKINLINKANFKVVLFIIFHCTFLPVEIYALPFGLDQYIPTNINTNSI